MVSLYCMYTIFSVTVSVNERDQLSSLFWSSTFLIVVFEEGGSGHTWATQHPAPRSRTVECTPSTCCHGSKQEVKRSRKRDCVEETIRRKQVTRRILTRPKHPDGYKYVIRASYDSAITALFCFFSCNTCCPMLNGWICR